jgi:hypothetical protein
VVSVSVTKCCVFVQLAFKRVCAELLLQLLQPIEMADIKEKRIFMNFCFNLEKPACETYGMLKKAFHDDTMSRTQTFE